MLSGYTLQTTENEPQTPTQSGISIISDNEQVVGSPILLQVPVLT